MTPMTKRLPMHYNKTRSLGGAWTELMSKNRINVIFGNFWFRFSLLGPCVVSSLLHIRGWVASEIDVGGYIWRLESWNERREAYLDPRERLMMNIRTLADIY